MAHQLFNLPRATAISNNLTLVSGAKVSFFLTSTSTPTDTYQDSGLTTPHTNPVVADSAGRLPAIYLDPEVQYRVTFTDADDVEIYPAIDPVNDQPITQDAVVNLLTQSIIGNLLYPRTAAEIAASVTPANEYRNPGDLRRYADEATLGNGTNDDTQAWVDCMAACSGAPYRMYVPAPASKYKVDSLQLESSLTIECDRGVIVEANTGFGTTDTLLNFDGTSNVTIIGNGATFQMLKSEYVSGENRHCFNLVDCSDYSISDVIAKDSGGDGFYINGATRGVLHNITADNNRRQGVSIIKATSLRGTGVWWLKNTTGTAPSDGLDIEPNGPTDSLIDINIEFIVSENNDGNGTSMYLDDYQSGSPEDVSITIGRLVSRGNHQGLRVRNCFLTSGSYGGVIKVGEVTSTDDSSNALYVDDKSVDGPFLDVGRVVAVNPCTGSSSFADTAAVYLRDTSATVCGGVHVGSVSVRASHTDMDYGIIAEMGAGFSDVRIGFENIVGAQVAPARLNNIDSTVAEATSMLIDLSKVRETVAITTGTNITASAHYGKVITNAGAGAGVTAAMQSYLPPGNAYRFRVEVAQTLSIDVFDANDHIVGTTTSGAAVSSNVIGAEANAYFLGTIGGVRRWRVEPLGSPDDWTWN